MPSDISNLPGVLPKRGLIWPSTWQLCKRRDRDRRIQREMVASGIPWAQKSVEPVLVDMFEVAQRIGLVETPGTHQDQLRCIQRGIFWARKLSKAVFHEFFCRLVEAQQKRNCNPRPLFDRKEHCALALAIRSFRQACDTYPSDDDLLFNSSIVDNHSWILESFDILRLLGDVDCAGEADNDGGRDSNVDVDMVDNTEAVRDSENGVDVAQSTEVHRDSDGDAVMDDSTDADMVDMRSQGDTPSNGFFHGPLVVRPQG